MLAAVAVATIGAACAPAYAHGAAVPAGLHATLPAPVVHQDAADVPSPIDLAAASFGQTGARFELRIRTRGPLPATQLGTARGRSLCLTIEQRRPARVQRVCLVPGRAGKLALVESRRRADGVYVGAHAVAAHVRHAGPDAIIATFAPPAVRLTRGRVVWHVTSEWLDGGACPAPSGGATSVCHDALPDRGGVVVRVHLGYVVGCSPAGASLRLNGLRSSRRVALTFDDGPGPQTLAVLRILRHAHVHATFFELGIQARLYPSMVRRTLAEGHVIGNHTWDHKPMTSLSSGDAGRELTRTSATIVAASGSTPCLFRPPGGALNATIVRLARQRELLSIVWDVDPRDWARPGTAAIVRNVLQHTRPGSIVLLHDAGGPRSETLAALPQIIAGLRARHLTFVTVPELLGLSPRVAWD